MESSSENPLSNELLLEQRTKVLNEIEKNKDLVKDLLNKSRVLHQYAGTNELGEGMRANLNNRIEEIKEKTNFTVPLATLGTINGEIITGTDVDTHTDLAEQLPPLDSSKPFEIRFISGFTFKHSNFPDISIIKYDLPFEGERKDKFESLIKSLKDQKAILINEEIEEIPLS